MKNNLGLALVFLLSTVFISLFTTSKVSAAQFNLSIDNKSIQVGDQFEVKVLLNTEDENINAVEGAVQFSQDEVMVKEIKSGNSIISFWSQAPKTTGTQVQFSGVIPGGYAGRAGLVLSIIFEAKSESANSVKLTKATALLNDGKGTQASVKISNLDLVIKGQTTEPTTLVNKDYDKDPPEEFTPAISKDETIFEGQNFLVFATQDKGSGVDYYEVCEGKSECVRAENMYLLKNQNLDEEITVYAVDKNGNKRIATITPSKSGSWYAKPLYLAIIVLTVLIFVIWKRKKRSL